MKRDTSSSVRSSVRPGERSLSSLRFAAGKAGVVKAVAKATTLAMTAATLVETLPIPEQSTAAATVLGGLAVAGSMVFAGANRRGERIRRERYTATLMQKGRALAAARTDALRNEVNNTETSPAQTPNAKPARRPNLLRRTFFAPEAETATNAPTSTTEHLGATAVGVASPAAQSRLEQLTITDQTERDVAALHQLAVDSIQVPPQAPQQTRSAK